MTVNAGTGTTVSYEVAVTTLSFSRGGSGKGGGKVHHGAISMVVGRCFGIVW